MKIALLAISITTFVLSGCSKVETAAKVDPQFVKSGDVKSIVIAKSEFHAKECIEKAEASGAKVLYQNENGVLMLDKDVAALELGDCAENTVPNEPIALAPIPDEQKKVELSTILRLIPAEEIGARSFISANPSYDGRGVLVAVLDTGVELAHQMLQKTTTGEDKILDLRDFSDEGALTMTTVTRGEDGIFKTAEGKSYNVKDIKADAFAYATFKASTLSQSEGLAKAESFEDVGVVVYHTADGWRGRIDTNNDLNFNDETELFNYRKSRKFTKLGKKKLLTVNMDVSADGTKASLAFDDGSHGTHVSGIIAGYDPKGLQGVAPGAQLIVGKLGDSRYSGGSTTTSSMIRSIDFAVESGAQIVNMSYGIRAGSNMGVSAIEKYVNKIAREKGIIFSISAGNEGPGLLTVGTPAGADLAITNAAFLSKNTARDNFGLINVEDDNTWFFSSVGPRLDGGLKPTLLAPGTALSSVPLWAEGVSNKSGTSMASPEVSGGLALLVSAAKQKSLLTDRASITYAVYNSAKKIPNLMLIEQGHGLMNVPSALEALQTLKAPPAEFKVSVNTASNGEGKGAGIFSHARSLPNNGYKVTVSPILKKDTTPSSVNLKTLSLVPSAPWIKTPPSLWVQSGASSFQVSIDQSILSEPHVHSEKITAIDESTGMVAFIVPVTVIAPRFLNDENNHTAQIGEVIKPGQTQRYFIDVPAGTTSLQVELASDGPVIRGQMLDSEGRKVVEFRDAEASVPMPALSAHANVARPGVYEIDVIAGSANAGPAKLSLLAKAYSLTATFPPRTAEGKPEIEIQNNFEAVKVGFKLELKSEVKHERLAIKGSTGTLTVPLTKEDQKKFESYRLHVDTNKDFYDLMTDYPFRVYDAKAKIVANGALELSSDIEVELSDLPAEPFKVEIQGAFASKQDEWNVSLTHERMLKEPVSMESHARLLFEPGQTKTLAFDISKLDLKATDGWELCPKVVLELPEGKRLQEISFCR